MLGRGHERRAAGSSAGVKSSPELPFAAMLNDPIGVVRECGQWRIAEHR
jgi:hypothetical protein